MLYSDWLSLQCGFDQLPGRLLLFTRHPSSKLHRLCGPERIVRLGHDLLRTEHLQRRCLHQADELPERGSQVHFECQVLLPHLRWGSVHRVTPALRWLSPEDSR